MMHLPSFDSRASAFISATCYIARTRASEEKFTKLRDAYQKLRTEHIDLLRTNGESQKQVQVAQKEKGEADEKAEVGCLIYFLPCH